MTYTCKFAIKNFAGYTLATIQFRRSRNWNDAEQLCGRFESEPQAWAWLAHVAPDVEFASTRRDDMTRWPMVRQQLRASGEDSRSAGIAWLAINAALLQPTAGKAWRAAFEAAETTRREAAVERLRAFRESPAGKQQQSYADRVIDQLLMRPYLGLLGPRQTLGVGPTATPQQIKTAYRKLAQKWHPDRDGGDAEQFIRIQEAYEMLKVFT